MAGTRTGLSAATDTSAARVARSASQARRCASKDATIAFRRCSTASSASCCRATAAALLVAPAAARAASPLGGVGMCVCAPVATAVGEAEAPGFHIRLYFHRVTLIFYTLQAHR